MEKERLLEIVERSESMVGPTGIWNIEEANGQHGSDPDLMKNLWKYFPMDEPIYDFGCGPGDYCVSLSTQGFEVEGFEGTPLEHLARFHPIHQVDLSEELVELERANILCLEVGEHIPPNRQQDLLHNIRKTCLNRAIVSWAIPGQGGYYHVNEQPNEVIIAEMARRGFSLHLADTLQIRKDSSFWWFKNTLMVFDRIKS